MCVVRATGGTRTRATRRARIGNRAREDARATAAMAAHAMDSLLVLGALGEIHARSQWGKTPIEALVEEIRGFAGLARDARMGATTPVSAFGDALGRFGLVMSECVPETALEAVMMDDEGSDDQGRTAKTTRLLILLGALCKGSFEMKVELVFRAMDVGGVRGITSEQAMEFAGDCVSVVGALLEERGDRVDLGWAVNMWTRCVKDAVEASSADDDLGMFTMEEFKALMRKMFDKMTRASLESPDLDRSRRSSGGETQRRRSLGSASERRLSQGSAHGFLDAPIFQAGLEYLTGASGGAQRDSRGGGGGSPAPAAIISKVLETVASPQQSSRKISDHARTQSGEHDVTPSHRASGSSNWASMIPEGIANMLGVGHRGGTHELKREPGMTDEEWEHAKIASEVEAARHETDTAEMGQAVQESNWSGIVDFVKELVIRIFLFNTVRLLLTIALLGGDAALCVYVIGHFGTVGGLGFVVVINVVISAIFMWFIVSFNKRERGKDNMQFGASLMQNIQDIAKSKATFEHGLGAFRGANESDTDHISPRSWNMDGETTPRAFGQASITGEQRRFRRTVSGTVLGERV